MLVDDKTQHSLGNIVKNMPSNLMVLKIELELKTNFCNVARNKKIFFQCFPLVEAFKKSFILFIDIIVDIFFDELSSMGSSISSGAPTLLMLS